MIPKSCNLASNGLHLWSYTYTISQHIDFKTIGEVLSPSATTHATTILKIAVPAPFRKALDYLPDAKPNLIDYQPGMRVLAPLGNRKVVGIITAVVHQSDLNAEKLRPIIKVMDEQPALDPSTLQLCRWAVNYYHQPEGDVYLQALPVLLRKAEHTTQEWIDTWIASQKGLLIDPAQLGRAERQIAALNMLREHPRGLAQQTLSGLNIKPPQLRALAEKGLAELHERPRHYKSWSDQPLLSETPFALNQEQQESLGAINQAEGFNSILIEGVTGSGKTEVYLQAIEHRLKQGKQALVLVPEINLTPQTVNRFKHRFLVPVICLHSNLTDRERLQAWRQAKANAAAIIIGTRSALFTPLKCPGIIIVDEEHDGSYKQQDGFRYSARDLAVVRAKIEKIPIVLGSATPSLESIFNAEQQRYQLCQISTRAAGAEPPSIQLLDMKKAELKEGLTQETLDAITDTLLEENQVLVFLNRRGFAPVLMCHDCGWQAQCRRCDARMTYHRQAQRLHCHHCDYQAPVPRHCSHCGSSDIRSIGQGTEKLEGFLSEYFKKTTVIRIDRDTTQRKSALENHLKVVHSGKPCLLIGTQMLAKGHHFPNVTLVVIADIDAGLFASDFRATEHTAQLIEQVAGRAGRAEKHGTVIIQTHHPEHPMLQTLARQGYAAFSQVVLAERKLLQFPPFSHLALIRAEATHADQATDFLQKLAHIASESQIPDSPTLSVDIWGPVPTLMQRKAGRHRFQLVLRAQGRMALHTMLEFLMDRAEELPEAKRVKWHLDVDPTYLE